MPLLSLRVVEVGSLPAAAYCARLLADFGADVVKLEPEGGDPARRASPIISTAPGTHESAWFGYLNFGKQSLIASRTTLGDALAGADVLLCSLGAAESAAIDLDAIRAASPSLVIADVTWFGRTGPYAGFAATDATCRALAGMVKLVGPVPHPLVAPDYQAALIGGITAFIAVMAALNGRECGDAGRRMDVSVHEACLALMDLQIADAWFRGAEYSRAGINRFPPTCPVGIYPTKDEWLGVTLVTPAQWFGFCRMLGLDDLATPEYTMGLERFPRQDALEARFIPKLRERSAYEWFEEALARRLPIVVVPRMQSVLDGPAFRERGALASIRFGDREVVAPRFPLHMKATPPRAGGAVPGLGAGALRRRAKPDAAVPARRAPGLPLDGVRIVDLSMGWAGPLASRMMADLGADIVKVEACQYPDWWRGVDNRPAVFEQRLYEKAGRFLVLNRNKRGITLDLTTADGVRIVKDLVRRSDAVIENYSTGVLPKLGLGYERMREVNSSLVMVSMSGYGASSAWRELRAYGSTLEHGSGLPLLVGREDDPPVMGHIAFGDAVGGLHAASALLVGLLHRRRTGVGQHVDLSQIECMLPFTAPWMMEQSVQGRVSPRRGNRHPDMAPHGCFPCAGEDCWLFVAVADDAMWQACCRVLGRADLAKLRSLDERRAQEDELERAIATWTKGRAPDAAMGALQEAGVAAGVVRSPLELVEDPHLGARGYWQWVERAFVGRHPQPSLPFREAAAAFPVRFPAPTLGQYNPDILGGLLGLGADEQARLAAAGVTGTEAVPAGR